MRLEAKMVRIYLTYGIATAFFFMWANHRGWRPINDLIFARTVWAASGANGFHK